AFGFGAKAFSQTAWQFQAAVVIWTVSEMMQAPLMSAIVTDLAPAHLRARYLGVFSMVFSSANMLGAPLGGMMLQRWGGRLLWLVTCCLALAAAGLFVLLRPRLGSRDEGPGSAHAARAAPDETPDPI
ncbi:MAG: MFS transporter, partial [Anaerolineae bacterium]